MVRVSDQVWPPEPRRGQSDEHRDRLVQVRLTEAQYREVADAAERADMTVSAWIRDTLGKKLGRRGR